MRTNTIIPISFGRDEIELLTLLDEGRKREYQTRSGWVKDLIREKYGSKKDHKEEGMITTVKRIGK